MLGALLPLPMDRGENSAGPRPPRVGSLSSLNKALGWGKNAQLQVSGADYSKKR